jgi:uncharacterized membrane protein
MMTAIRLFSVLLSIAYPFIVFWGLHSNHYQTLIVFLGLLLLSRFWLATLWQERLMLTLMVALLVSFVLFSETSTALKLYPVMINLSLFTVFVMSLHAKESVIEKLAKLREPDLPAEGIAYTRKVTIAWSVFFLLNATIAFITVFFMSSQAWMLYNGVIAYVLIAVMFSVEWLIRQRVRRQ